MPNDTQKLETVLQANSRQHNRCQQDPTVTPIITKAEAKKTQRHIMVRNHVKGLASKIRLTNLIISNGYSKSLSLQGKVHHYPQP